MHNDAFSPTLYPIQRVITSRFLKRSFFTVRPYKKAACFVQRFLGIRRMLYPTTTRQWHWMPIEGTGCLLECSCYISACAAVKLRNCIAFNWHHIIQVSPFRNWKLDCLCWRALRDFAQEDAEPLCREAVARLQKLFYFIALLCLLQDLRYGR